MGTSSLPYEHEDVGTWLITYRMSQHVSLKVCKTLPDFQLHPNGAIGRGDQSPLPFLLAELRKHTVVSLSLRHP